MKSFKLDIKKTFFFFYLVILALCGCATQPKDPEALKQFKEANDPLEPYNRVMTDFNFKVNRYVYQPFNKGYRFIVPETIRTNISNVSDNLSQPYYFVNALLQGDWEDSAQTFGRFFTNTTLGVFGLFDVATMLDIDNTKKDFGQTLYKWGWKEPMPYFVWPFLGPSDIRETIGSVTGFFLDPVDYILPNAEEKHLLLFKYSLKGIVTIDNVGGLLENIEKTSVDPYVALRTMYRQNRAKFLNENNIEAQIDSYNFDFEFEEDIE